MTDGIMYNPSLLVLRTKSALTGLPLASTGRAILEPLTRYFCHEGVRSRVTTRWLASADSARVVAD